ncbi:MAG: hypothetical protein ACYC9L_08835 [Sulfuricaulis sp.]
MNSKTRFKKTTLGTAITLALSINSAALILSGGVAQASEQACTSRSSYSTDSGNFSMLSGSGFIVGGTNDVTMTWDGKAYTDSTDYSGPGGASNVTASSTTAFFSHRWTAHDIQVFAPGSYTFDTTQGGGNAESGIMNVSVPNGDIGMHMLFNWNGNNNIDVFLVAALSSVFGAGIGYTTQATASGAKKCATSIKNCLFDGKNFGSAGKPAGNKTWMLASAVNGSSVGGVAGVPMATGGPFAGFNANFNFYFPGQTVTLTPGSICNPSTVVSAFSFTPVTGANISTIYTSANTVTVSYSSGSGSVPVSISGGKYSQNGGAYTSASGTAVAGDTFKVQQTTGTNEDGTTSTASLSIGGTIGTFQVTVMDAKPAAFTFTPVSGATAGTTYTSNTITVSGMDTGLTAPISITGGEYSKNGGAFTNATGTVTDGDTIAVQLTATSATAIATLSLGSASNGTLVSGDYKVSASQSSSGNNFTMLDSGNNIVGGTNDVVMTWDGQCETSTATPVTPTNAHMELSSVTPFFGHDWTAHHIRVFCPGTYTINVDCTTAQLEAGTCTANANPARNYTFTVGQNQYGGDMLFDWNGTTNINVVEVWDYKQSEMFSPSSLYTGATGSNPATTTWDFMSSDTNASCPGAVDGNGNLINCGQNGINGTGMINGPFLGFSANFNLNLAGAISNSNYQPTVNIATPSNSPGCSISSTPVSVLERADWWLVAGFLAWLGGVRMRLKRKTRS